MITARRGFLLGGAALLLAPSIVRASSLMPTSTAPLDSFVRELFYDDWSNGLTHVRYDVLHGGLQYGFDRIIEGEVRANPARRADIANLFRYVEKAAGRPVSMARLECPKDPLHIQ